jgi:hypothetical protein
MTFMRAWVVWWCVRRLLRPHCTSPRTEIKHHSLPSNLALVVTVVMWYACDSNGMIVQRSKSSESQKYMLLSLA